MKPHALDRSRYSADLLARVTAGWCRLADDQRAGVVTAAHLAADLAAMEAPSSILAMAAHVVQDEVHHVDVCERVLEELTPGQPPAPQIELALGLRHRPLLGEAELARRLVTELALGKPVAAASLAAARACVREPLFAWAYAELLHDETRHATFGAKAAAWVIRSWTPRQREAFWTDCLTTGTPAGTRSPSDPEAEALGLLPSEVECAVPRWILPHLAPLGLQTRPANAQVH
jgi:hypothetical protein